MHLSHIAAQNGAIVLFDFENYRQWLKLLGLSVENEADLVRLNELYQLFSQTLVPEATGILMSPHFGWEAINQKPAGVGIVFSLEQKVDNPEVTTLPMLNNQWTIEHIRNNYGIAKLKLYYHPTEKLASKKRKLVAELFEYSQYEKIDFILEVITYNADQTQVSSDEQNDILLTSVKHFRQSCDLLVLEGTVNPLMAATITAELDVPWIAKILTVDSYQNYKESIRMLIENGTTGAIFGPELLADLLANYSAMSQDNLIRAIQDQGRDRLIELGRIIKEGKI